MARDLHYFDSFTTKEVEAVLTASRRVRFCLLERQKLPKPGLPGKSGMYVLEIISGWLFENFSNMTPSYLPLRCPFRRLAPFRAFRSFVLGLVGFSVVYVWSVKCAETRGLKSAGNGGIGINS